MGRRDNSDASSTSLNYIKLCDASGTGVAYDPVLLTVFFVVVFCGCLTEMGGRLFKKVSTVVLAISTSIIGLYSDEETTTAYNGLPRAKIKKTNTFNRYKIITDSVRGERRGSRPSRWTTRNN